jgi:uroporphyrinogen-III synthase
MRVIVTRPRAQADTLVHELQGSGIDAVALPLIHIAPLSDVRPLQQAWAGLAGTALVVFVSANAVLQFMRQRPAHAAWPVQLLAASTGPGTSAALRAAGVPAALLVQPAGEVFDSEALWHELQPRDWHARHVCVVRGEGGRDWLAERLAAAGAHVEFVSAYQRQLPRLDAQGQDLLDAAAARPRQHLWLFSSSQAVEHLGQLAPGVDWSAASAVAPHARIAARVQQLGFGHVGVAALDATALAQSLAAAERRSIQSGTA